MGSNVLVLRSAVHLPGTRLSDLHSHLCVVNVDGTDQPSVHTPAFLLEVHSADPTFAVLCPADSPVGWRPVAGLNFAVGHAAFIAAVKAITGNAHNVPVPIYDHLVRLT